MKVLKITIVLIFFEICFLFSSAKAFTSLSDCLVTHDLGIFKFDSKTARMGSASGVVGLTGHFQDHMDQICTGDYSNIDEVRGLPDEEAYQKIFTVEVQVTQHAGSDSDRWLLHEVERDFRSYYGLPDESFVARQIDNNTVIALSGAGWTYRWISGNKIVQIQYHDSMMEKPEPIEVVKAYLAKHPSTLTAMTSTDLRTEANKTKWIKDEMDRRLWLCDKWFEQLQLGKATQSQALEEVVKSMNIFLDYREKYYGVNAADDKNLLDGYLTQNDEANIKTKLQEYKTWWSANKTGSLIGILSVYAHRAYNEVSDIFRKLFSFLTSLWERLLAMFG